MELALREPAYALVLWSNGGERLEIKTPTILEYFRTFRDSIHEEDERGVVIFYENVAHQLPLRMWQQAIEIYEAYDKVTGGGGLVLCPLTLENTDGKLAILDRYELFDLYALAKALDFYDSPLLLHRVEQVIVRHLLRLSVDEIVDKHQAMPVLDFSKVGAATNPFLAINRAYSERLLAQDYALHAYGLNENLIHAIHHKRPQTRQVIWVGGEFSIVLTEDGLYGCGANVYDQLGRDGGLSVHTFEHLGVKEVVISVACGKDHALINTTHGLYGVGSNMQGQLGVGVKPLRRDEPRLRRLFFPGVLPQPVVLEVACAGAYSMMRTSDGLYACGANYHGQLGVGNLQPRYTPTKVLLPCNVSVRSLSLSTDSAMFLTSDGAVYSCGTSLFGTVPTNVSVPTKVPLTVEMGRPLKVCRGFMHCVLLTTTGLYGVGATAFGALGPLNKKGETSVREWTLIPSLKREEIKSVFVGSGQTFVLMVDGSLMACGNNRTSQLGIKDGDRDDFVVYRFNKVDLPSPVITVASSTGHTLFLTRTGLYGVGGNREGQLGLDPAIVGNIVDTPTKIPLRMGNEEMK